MKNFALSTKKTLNIRGRILDLSSPIVMGIMNVTPDSFYDGGKVKDDYTISEKAEKIVSEGATILDLGGYSTRPGALEISEEEEIKRLLPALKIIIKKYPGCIVSIDTFRSEVARICMEEGALMINDVACLLDKRMADLALHYQIPYIMMHSRGNPRTMTKLNTYNIFIKDIISELLPKIKFLEEKGVKDIILDPGFGFAKNIEQNYHLLQELDLLKIFHHPILVGLSRKSLVYKILGIDVNDSLNGTTVLNTIAILKGSSILRVHDVKEAVQIISLLTQANIVY